MELIEYTKEFTLLDLTPLKYSICSLIISFSKLSSEKEIFIYYETIDSLINNFLNEISKSELENKIKINLIKVCENKNIEEKEEKEIENKIILELRNNLNKIKTINDLYSVFRDEIPSLRFDSQNEIQNYIFSNGGHIDNFLRKCLNSFNRMSFPQLIKLYEDIIKYNNEEKINISLGYKETDNFFEELFSSQNNIPSLEDFSNFSQKFLFEIPNKDKSSSLSEKLFNLHKFYDYNLKYLYNENSSSNETKIHYSLLYLANLYYDCGYYKKAIQILFECVKLSQSNCDHEALLKCFLWLSMIYTQIGNFKLASQCLSTCLIKSFQNNFQLLYLNSSIELSNLNFIFNSDIGYNEKNKHTLDQKILRHSNNYSHLFKNISDYYTLKDKETKNDLDNMMTYSNIHLIQNLMLKGEYSLTIQYLKIMIQEIFLIIKKENNNLTEAHNEIMNNLICLMMNIMEYDYNFSLDIIINLLNLKINGLYFIDKDNIFLLIINKYCSEYEDYIFKEPDEEYIIYKGVYYNFVFEFFKLYHEFNKNELIDLEDNSLETKLLLYISKCDEFHINAYKIKASILLSRLYNHEGRISDSIFILKKILNNEKLSKSVITVTQIYLAYNYFKLEMFNKVNNILNKIHSNVENICDLNDKFFYYYLYSIFYKKSEHLNTCLKYAILQNNKSKIKMVLSLINNDNNNNLSLKINELLIQNKKYFDILNEYSISPRESIDIIFLINKKNNEFLNSI